MEPKSLLIMGIVVIAVSAIIAWTTNTCIKNVEIKPKTKIILQLISVFTAFSLAMGTLLIAGNLFFE